MPFEHKPWKSRDNYEIESYNSESKVWLQQMSDNGTVLMGVNGNGDDDSAFWMIFSTQALDQMIMILLWYRMRIKDE